MTIVCGVDIGNSTTEVTLSKIYNDKSIKYLSSYSVKTTGIKGTLPNIAGIRTSVYGAIKKANLNIEDIELIKINEASPVIGESAMETISETIITDSAMIGHNPDTPSGEGVAIGYTVSIKDILNKEKNKSYIVIVEDGVGYSKGAIVINDALDKGYKIKGAILKEDEAVLLNNRLKHKIPIIDEVKNTSKIPLGNLAAIEVAGVGKTLKTLSNPFGISGIFNLSPEDTKRVVPIAKGLIGLRSGVIIKTPKSEVVERKIKAGKLKIIGSNYSEEVDINLGANLIMKKANLIGDIEDIEGERSTNISFMINGIKDSMAEISRLNIEDIKIKDILAIDTTVNLKIKGGIAEETYKEKAVAIAAMVKTHKLPLIRIKEKLEEDFKIKVEVNGVEGVMASIGALTTKGTKLPIAIIDMGGGSTDIALLEKSGEVRTVHLAGAGELATVLINLELNVNDRNLAEEIKKNIVGKVESLYTLRLETGEIRFYDEPLNPKLYGRVVIVKENELIPIYKDITISEIIKVRRKVKEEIFIKNVLRGLEKVSPMNTIHLIPNVVLVGGSALDFEIPDMIVKELANYGIAAGCGNIRGCEGPRHAVSTGLVLHYIERL